MNRLLQYANLFGIVAMAVLCVIQWRSNRSLNLEVGRLEKIRAQQETKMGEQTRTISGYAADLDAFRENLTRANTLHRDTEARLKTAENQIEQLRQEDVQLRMSVTNWAQAVQARDEQLRQANGQMQKLAADRDAAVQKFNEIAERYNAVVNDLNSRTKDFNALVEKYNALAKSQR
jgi:chromosome segregation ATPase